MAYHVECSFSLDVFDMESGSPAGPAHVGTTSAWWDKIAFHHGGELLAAGQEFLHIIVVVLVGMPTRPVLVGMPTRPVEWLQHVIIGEK